MKKPSVLFINRVYPPMRGASGRVLRDLARGFAKDGWSVSVLTTGDESISEKDGVINVRRVKGPGRIKYPAQYLWVWLKLYFASLKMERRDLVVTLTDPPMLILIGRRYARRHKAKHVHWCHDLYPDLLPAMGLKLPKFVMHYFSKISRRAMKSCDRVITIGRCMAQQLTHTGVDTGKVTIIPNWPDLEILDPRRAKKTVKTKIKNTVEGAKIVSELLRDDSPKFRILYAGNIGKAHPMSAIMDAAQILSDHSEIEFVFVGDGPNHDRLAQERDKRGLQNVKLLPYQPVNRLRNLMESGDIHLISMRDDTAGMLVPCKFYSALAVGRPSIYIGPPDTEIARVITDYSAGTVVTPGDGPALALAILKYRMNESEWFAAQEGALAAGQVFVPDQSIRAWIDRAGETIGKAA